MSQQKERICKIVIAKVSVLLLSDIYHTVWLTREQNEEKSSPTCRKSLKSFKKNIFIEPLFSVVIKKIYWRQFSQWKNLEFFFCEYFFLSFWTHLNLMFPEIFMILSLFNEWKILWCLRFFDWSWLHIVFDKLNFLSLCERNEMSAKWALGEVVKVEFFD